MIMEGKSVVDQFDITDDQMVRIGEDAVSEGVLPVQFTDAESVIKFLDDATAQPPIEKATLGFWHKWISPLNIRYGFTVTAWKATNPAKIMVWYQPICKNVLDQLPKEYEGYVVEYAAKPSRNSAAY